MNRIPPNLLYLTIFNPTLQPSGPIKDDDEDAEEQAHILFYTSKERAVSRDRMLRQVGLAKALINYAELFDTDSSCDNVHSQSRRMIMISPEPGFWIHAGIEVAKALRDTDQKNKSKSKGKQSEKGKGKEKDATPVYDYEEGSVHDGALRAHIFEGYERFKLSHGSFTTILSTLGQQALELQLERYWTVWAWSWDLEQLTDFKEEFGPQLHPHFSSLIPLINKFSESLSANNAVILTRSHIIPSSRYSEGRYPAALWSHLSSMIPPKLDPSHSSDTLASSVDTIKGKHLFKSNTKGSPNNGAMNFLSMPAINMKMDIPKWNWPNYLTFGKGGGSKSISDKISDASQQKEEESTVPADHQKASQVEVEVNTEDLEDAISSDSLSILSKEGNGSSVNKDETSLSDTGNADDNQPFIESTNPMSSSLSNILSKESESSSSPPPRLPGFSITKVHLSSTEDSSTTTQLPVSYLIRDEFMLALIRNMDEDVARLDDSVAIDMKTAAETALNLFDSIDSNMYDAELASMSESLPSATKILQPQDRYLISTGQYTSGTFGISSVSSHLFNAKAILDKDSDITEVFSRGQNPQHWHIAKRGLGGPAIDPGVSTEEAVFMEVFRKETSLTDVDNVVIGVVKKSGLSESEAHGTGPGSR